MCVYVCVCDEKRECDALILLLVLVAFCDGSYYTKWVYGR